MNNYLSLSPEVEQALKQGKPVVALESTIISHGMPYPQNVETALKVEQTIRDNGAVPATIAIIGGKLKAGCTPEEIEYLGKKGQVKHCLIQNNTFNYNANCMGGGVGNDAVDAATDICAEDCWIRNNSGTHGGGARVRGTLLNCVIENNNTNNSVKKGPAGGVHLQGGRMVNCIVRGNTSGGDTGGARALNTSLIENCTIENNISLGKTGGVSLEGTSTLSNSIIKNNTSTTECGGVRSAAKSNIYNNLIYGNTAGTKQGGLLIESALPNVIGNTIVCNNQLTGTGSQAGVFITNTLEANGTFFVNNVVWGNMSNGTVESQGVYYISRYDKSTGQRSYNAIIGQKGDDSAETSIQLSADDPGFTDAAHGDFSLLPTSVLLDRGNSAKATVSKDLAGNDRIVNSSVDIGAYEYPVVASDVYVLEGEDLQSKINNTATGYTVYVQAGTYYGNFTMKDGVNVSGGWNADFTEQTDYATILDAQESGRVVNQPAAFSTLTIWSNLTIQNGKLTADQTDKLGAGVVLNKKGQVKHCIIQNNVFTTGSNGYGGGVGNDAVDAASDILIDDCIIRGNTATHGGGVRIKGTIQNSIIENNKGTEGKAPAIFVDKATLYVSYSSIVNEHNLETKTSTGYDAIYGQGIAIANNNWWGTNDPTSLVNGTNITIDKWVIMNVDANATDVLPGDEVKVTVDFNHVMTSAGEIEELAGGVIPKEAYTVTFAAENGTVIPETLTINNGESGNAVFTASDANAKVTATCAQATKDIIFVGEIPEPYTGIVYVSPDGSDRNNGSAEAPVASFCRSSCSNYCKSYSNSNC